MILQSTKQSLDVYQELLERGVCPEQARLVLPQNMMTEFIETGSLAAYARLCKLRISPDAQKEIRDVAEMVSQHMERAFPVSWRAFSSSS
jgi:thymidylate synthase (FAD)